jgi:hypothetical protein
LAETKRYRWLSSRERRILVLVVCLAGAIGAGVWVWHLPAARRQIAVSTSQKPAAFTELYFTDPAALPKHLSTASPSFFGVTVANHEGTTVVYSYLVTVQSILGTATIAQGQVSIAAGGRRDALEQFTPPQAGIAYEFTVQLLGRPEAIHFTGMS